MTSTPAAGTRCTPPILETTSSFHHPLKRKNLCSPWGRYEAEDDGDSDKQIRLEDVPPHLRSLNLDQPANPSHERGFAGSVPPEEQVRGDHAPEPEDVDTTGPALEAVVFGAASRLKHIRKAAHSRMVTPWLSWGRPCRVVTEVPLHIVLPPSSGRTPASTWPTAWSGGKSGR